MSVNVNELGAANYLRQLCQNTIKGDLIPDAYAFGYNIASHTSPQLTLIALLLLTLPLLAHLQRSARSLMKNSVLLNYIDPLSPFQCSLIISLSTFSCNQLAYISAQLYRSLLLPHTISWASLKDSLWISLLVVSNS